MKLNFSDRRRVCRLLGNFGRWHGQRLASRFLRNACCSYFCGRLSDCLCSLAGRSRVALHRVVLRWSSGRLGLAGFQRDRHDAYFTLALTAVAAATLTTVATARLIVITVIRVFIVE